MKRAKWFLGVFAVIGMTGCFSNYTPKHMHRDFPPRVDLYLEEELVKRPQDFASTLEGMGARELQSAENLPREIADTILWIIGI